MYFFVGVPLRVALSAVSFFAYSGQKKDAAIIANAARTIHLA